MTRSPGLSALVADGVFLAHEAQLHLTDLFGEHERWDVDLENRQFRFTGPTPATLPLQLLGSAAPGPRSWLWGWANPSGYGPEVLAGANAARALGERYRIPELVGGEVPFDDPAPEQEPEPGYELGWDLSIAARVASGIWFGYSGRVQGGTRVWMLLEGLELPAPSTPRVARIIGEALMTTTVTDHRRAVSSYAALRGIAWDGATLTLPDGRLSVTFDEQGRLAGLNGTAGPA
ncbi:DUF6882 domain-containing protein [Schumannella sp. 10F1B-5-1]|uniref:DUF6882 domain-containing protein n=1 Tax=Schumannella sp. 10F1B-5-1 TaxID=2590780 RepID=UPI00113071B4|nr:DUF6882 domain-containing protein [Schumannella sp. 10F1B-5-1]TPW72364.1 hypothetical protein FJ658_08845 [Schumannella sp. 10F1B-5-1]